MAILESVKELASKLGADTNGRDITDQLNKINKHLDETALSGRDIAEAVKTYSENASGGGGETFEINLSIEVTRDNASFTWSKTRNEIIEAYDSGKIPIGNCTLTYPDQEPLILPFIYWDKNNINGDTNDIYLYSKIGEQGGDTVFLIVSRLSNGNFFGQGQGRVMT